jgi:hypothetical protein
MSHCVIDIQADRIEMGEPWREGKGPLHQSVRLYQNGRCVCRMAVVFLDVAEVPGSVRLVDGRQAGERD